MKLRTKSMLVGSVVAGALAAASPSSACGGFFCNQSQPVNQAAERIVFADNGDGTQTAVIEIMYEGPSENFSWLLPISSVPMGDEIAVASTLAFQRLQAATNPNYTLTTSVEGTCKQPPQQTPGIGSGGTGGTASGGGTSGGLNAGPDDGVTVEASGVVGSFDWTVISLDPDLAEPADAAVTWLNDNGYDVPDGAPVLLSPYLADGLFLLALKLTKGADAGSIRPIMLTYKATRPSIPIKLTAVAANEDMGVMAWVLADSRAVPQNYLSLELNEARINWFNASLNYNNVVIEAANDAQGQGFVTELAGPTSTLASLIWSQYDESRWQTFSTRQYASFSEIFESSYYTYGSYDGYWEAVDSAVTLPDGVLLADFKLCPSCYSGQIEFSPSAFIAAIEKGVVQPMRAVQQLIDAHPTITRLYTTMSADEMTLDPLFTFNPDLAAVSNLHTAERIIECNPSIYQSEAPWRIELPQGGIVRGTAADFGTWPAALADMPPNRKIVRDAESGAGKVVEDKSETINAMLDEYNETVPAPAPSSGGSSGTGGAGSGGGGQGGTTGGSVAAGGSGAVGGTSTGGVPRGDDTGDGSTDAGCACSTSSGGGSSSALAALFGLIALRLRRRRR
jgi:MYXO-CTERM domain-containing protein